MRIKKIKYSKISARTFPLGKFLNRPFGIINVENELKMVVRDYGSAGCAARRAGQSAWFFMFLRFAGISFSDENEGSSTMLNPDLFLGFMYMFQ